jgi:hypothetical protein
MDEAWDGAWHLLVASPPGLARWRNNIFIFLAPKLVGGQEGLLVALNP